MMILNELPLNFTTLCKLDQSQKDNWCIIIVYLENANFKRIAFAFSRHCDALNRMKLGGEMKHQLYIISRYSVTHRHLVGV